MDGVSAEPIQGAAPFEHALYLGQHPAECDADTQGREFFRKRRQGVGAGAVQMPDWPGVHDQP